MRGSASGWRTTRSRQSVAAPPAPPVRARAASSSIAAPVSMPLGTGATLDAPAVGAPWQGVQWSLPLVGLLAYTWAVVTYSLPLGAGAVAMTAALVGLVIAPGGAFRFPMFVGWLGAFLVWAWFGTLSSDYKYATAQDMELLVKIWLITLVVVNALRTRGMQRIFMFVFLGAFALYPMRGAIFNYVGGYTIFGRALWNHIYANPNDLAALALLQLGMAGAMYVREPKGWPKLAALAGLMMLPMLVLMTQSRGAFLALTAFGLLVVVGQRRRGRALVVVVVLGGIAALLAPDGVWERVRGLRNATDTTRLEEVDAEGSAKQRFEIWKVARAIASEHSVAGVGLGAYGPAHGVYAQRGDFLRTASGERDTHSTYLKILAETGAVGFGLFVCVFGTVAWKAERTRRRASALLPVAARQIFFLELGLAAFFTAGIFGSFGMLAFTYVHLALLWCVTETTGEELQLVERHGAVS